MSTAESAERRANAARQFDMHEQSTLGEPVTLSISAGLTTLRNLIFTRIHEDVQTNFGIDSMIMPVSPQKSEQQTKIEIELFQIAESTICVAGRKMVADPQWYCDWLGRMRMGEHFDNPRIGNRIRRYLAMSDNDRRLAFMRVLEKAFPESRHAPLVMYRLIPLGIGIVTAVAFGRTLEANELRNRQMACLPPIADCYDCHGRPLENGEQCRQCGNPMWTFKWLTTT